ncbi:hypothetical protein EHP00_875 [Ecytonucleospora hepatopenaei]|uniref:Uncharacterized protein n=1 Tax=Ecytonucleospora hepatopenaei TaxID=646526 RepID=A0A1W0E3X9_9MICR|nr:hypothetical protein EHP00_875 [Ecytonucleospora hepatopenaei]
MYNCLTYNLFLVIYIFNNLFIRCAYSLNPSISKTKETDLGNITYNEIDNTLSNPPQNTHFNINDLVEEENIKSNAMKYIEKAFDEKAFDEKVIDEKVIDEKVIDEDDKSFIFNYSNTLEESDDSNILFNSQKTLNKMKKELQKNKDLENEFDNLVIGSNSKKIVDNFTKKLERMKNIVKRDIHKNKKREEEEKQNLFNH